MIKIQVLKSFPPNSNPFHHDGYHMGTQLGSNVTVMHENHSDKFMRYLIIVNTETGDRIRIDFQEEKEKEG